MRFNILSIALVAILMTLGGCGGGGGGSSESTYTPVIPNAPIVPSVPDTLDTTPPVITIIGSNPLDIAQNSTYVDAGAVAQDDKDGPVNVNTTGSVNTEILGNYILTYMATDIAGNTSSATRSVNVLDSSRFVNISGTVTYDKVPADSDYIGLDYDNITQEAVKVVRVDAINASNQNIASAATDASGYYSLSVLSDTQIKIRVSARMLKAGTPNWDVKVVDNSNSNALYVMEGSLSSSGTTDSQRNLNALSGWGGSSYTGTRTAAPFAMLDTVYSAMQKVLSADTQIMFPALQVNWSINNIVSESINYELGLIGTSHYTKGNLYILGDEDVDTDEYDDHVIAHEWGHYYEDKFSRSDSIGGEHGGEDTLDIRVAFGEGWGNAFSGMALENPVYFDTSWDAQANGFNFNIESGTSANKGWYSESSIERILYDLYDADDEGSDALNLGFEPIHKVFIGAEKTTPAFTSIFTFIKALKDENTGDMREIDSIVSSEDIAPIVDIYGTGRTNLPSEIPDYVNLVVGGTVNVCPTYAHGTYNKLGNRKYIRFDINTAGNYTITVSKSSNTSKVSDPDFLLYNVSLLHAGTSGTENSEIQTVYLSDASYKLDISDYNNVPDTCFNVSVK